MRKSLPVLFCLLILLLGCQKAPIEKGPLCTAPYFEWQKGQCCLDANQNSVCDNDEKSAEQPIVKQPAVEPPKEQAEKEPATIPQLNTPQINTQDMLEKALNKVVKITVQTGANNVMASGFVVSSDGYILTNWHVVEPAFDPNMYCISETSYSDCINIAVEFKDGRQFSQTLDATGITMRLRAQVKLIGGNKPHDIALLKIIPQQNFEYFEFANSELAKVGDPVFALGSPEGLEFSTSRGVISAKNRKGFADESVTKYIQTDAAVNRGNSGGPLINEQGQVVGINTFAYNKAITEGLNFALESNTAKEFYEILKQIKADVPGRICTLKEDGKTDCSYPIVRPPRLKSNPDAEIEVTKIDLDGIKETGQYTREGASFFSFSVAMKNNKEEPKDVCFKLLVIEDGIKKQDTLLEKRITLKPKVNFQETIPVSGVQTSGDGYFEINAIECANPMNVYATGYARY